MGFKQQLKKGKLCTHQHKGVTQYICRTEPYHYYITDDKFNALHEQDDPYQHIYELITCEELKLKHITPRPLEKL